MNSSSPPTLAPLTQLPGFSVESVILDVSGPGSELWACHSPVHIMKEDRGVVGVSKAYLPHKEISLIVGHQQVCFSPVEVKKKKKAQALGCSVPFTSLELPPQPMELGTPPPPPSLWCYDLICRFYKHLLCRLPVCRYPVCFVESPSMQSERLLPATLPKLFLPKLYTFRDAP